MTKMCLNVSVVLFGRVTAATAGTYLKDFECRFDHKFSFYNFHVLLLCETDVLCFVKMILMV